MYGWRLVAHMRVVTWPLWCVGTGSHGGNHVEVEGSFDNWSTRQVLQRTGKDFTIVKLMPPGVYQVRYPSYACKSVLAPL